MPTKDKHVTTSTCRKCHKEKDISDFYGSDKNNCKECIKEKARKYRDDNIEKVKEYDRNRPNHKERVEKNKDRVRKLKELDPKWKPRHLREKKTDEDIKEYKARYYQENKEKSNAQSKRWAKENIESVRKSSREWAKRNRKTQNKNTLVWKAKNKHKTSAHDKVKHAIKWLKITKPKECEHCSIETILHGHHHDYTKPLEVTWLCPVCHKAEHKRINAERRV